MDTIPLLIKQLFIVYLNCVFFFFACGQEFIFVLSYDICFLCYVQTLPPHTLKPTNFQFKNKHSFQFLLLEINKGLWVVKYCNTTFLFLAYNIHYTYTSTYMNNMKNSMKSKGLQTRKTFFLWQFFSSKKLNTYLILS